jgi:hypothetical protein
MVRPLVGVTSASQSMLLVSPIIAGWFPARRWARRRLIELVEDGLLQRFLSAVARPGMSEVVDLLQSGRAARR